MIPEDYYKWDLSFHLFGGVVLLTFSTGAVGGMAQISGPKGLTSPIYDTQHFPTAIFLLLFLCLRNGYSTILKKTFSIV